MKFGMVRSLANRRLRYSPNLMNFGLLFREAKFFHGGYLAHFCWRATKFGSVRDIGGWQVLRDLGKLWSGGPAIPCGDLRQSVIDVLVFSTISHPDRRCDTGNKRTKGKSSVNLVCPNSRPRQNAGKSLDWLD